MSDLDVMLRFLLQASVILIVAAGFRALGRRIGQTGVVMEMVAGIALGPSLFGLVWPAGQRALFPIVAAGGERDLSMRVLYVVAQIGLILTMFLVGMEFDPRLLRERAKGAAAVATAGIAAPLVLGGFIGVFALTPATGFFAPGVGPLARGLYLGAAIAITAFPMLARIIQERGIAGTRLGTLALAAGAANDAVAWVLLALVIALAKGSAAYVLVAVVGGTAFVLLVPTLGRRLLAPMSRRIENGETLTEGGFVAILVALLLGALATDAIGVYAVFGAFIVGIAVPRGALVAELNRRIGPLAKGLFLPFFFVFSGLNTRLSSLDGAGAWAIAGLILLAAIVGKGVACALAARVSGESLQDSLRLGALMNARGLMELILLDVGRAQGIVRPPLYTALALMAVATTLMASPLFLAAGHRSDR